jgi:hypothetical protein
LALGLGVTPFGITQISVAKTISSQRPPMMFSYVEAFHGTAKRITARCRHDDKQPSATGLSIRRLLEKDKRKWLT